MVLQFDAEAIEFLKVRGSKVHFRVKETGFEFEWDLLNMDRPPPKELAGLKKMQGNTNGNRTKGVVSVRDRNALHSLARRTLGKQENKQESASSKMKNTNHETESAEKESRPVESADKHEVDSEHEVDPETSEAYHPYGSLLVMAETQNESDRPSTIISAPEEVEQSDSSTNDNDDDKDDDKENDEDNDDENENDENKDLEEEILKAVIARINEENKREQDSPCPDGPISSTLSSSSTASKQKRARSNVDDSDEATTSSSVPNDGLEEKDPATKRQRNSSVHNEKVNPSNLPILKRWPLGDAICAEDLEPKPLPGDCGDDDVDLEPRPLREQPVPISPHGAKAITPRAYHVDPIQPQAQDEQPPNGQDMAALAAENRRLKKELDLLRNNGKKSTSELLKNRKKSTSEFIKEELEWLRTNGKKSKSELLKDQLEWLRTNGKKSKSELLKGELVNLPTNGKKSKSELLKDQLEYLRKARVQDETTSRKLPRLYTEEEVKFGQAQYARVQNLEAEVEQLRREVKGVEKQRDMYKAQTELKVNQLNMKILEERQRVLLKDQQIVALRNKFQPSLARTTDRHLAMHRAKTIHAHRVNTMFAKRSHNP